MKIFLFGKHRRLLSKVMNAVWWNEELETKVELLNLSSTLAVRFRRLSYFHQHKIHIFGVASFCVTYLTAALFNSNLGVFSCLLILLSYVLLLGPLLCIFFGANTSWSRGDRFNMAAILLEEESSNPKVIIEEQLNVYAKVSSRILRYLVLPFGTASMGTLLFNDFWDALLGHLGLAWQINGFGVVTLFVTGTVLLFWLVFVVFPFLWMIWIQDRLEPVKERKVI